MPPLEIVRKDSALS